MARVIADLYPRLQIKITELQKLCESKGLKIGIGECVRTVAEQDALYAKGRTDKSSGIVTNAKGNTYGSMHQFGVAFDFYRNDGKGAYYDNDGFFTKVGKLGQSIGLEWGGSWSSIIDKPHFQLPDWGSTTSKLKSLYGTPEKFKLTWNYTPTSLPITKDSAPEDIEWLQNKLNNALKDVNGFIPLKVDGDYGTNTVKAVIKFYELQKWETQGLSVGKNALPRLAKY